MHKFVMIYFFCSLFFVGNVITQVQYQHQHPPAYNQPLPIPLRQEQVVDNYVEPNRDHNIYEPYPKPGQTEQIYSAPTYGGNILTVKPDQYGGQELSYEQSLSGVSEEYRSPYFEQTSDVLSPERRVEERHVECRKNHMVVNLKFSAPFGGFIYPHGHFPSCILFEGRQSDEATITLHHGPCGRRIVENENDPDFTALIEHRLMIQWERDFICEDDSSVIVRCEKPDDFNKTIAWDYGAREFAATLESGKHPGPKMWMEIQRGEGPNAQPLLNKQVFIGDTLTLIFTVSDDVFWFDANVISCIASAGPSTEQIEWEGVSQVKTHGYSGYMATIEDACSVKRKIFSDIFKEKITKDKTLITLNYAHFKAFRFPTSLKVVLQCDVQICYQKCEELPSCGSSFEPRAANKDGERRRRSVEDKKWVKREGVTQVIEVYTREEAGATEVPVKAALTLSENQIVDVLWHVIEQDDKNISRAISKLNREGLLSGSTYRTKESLADALIAFLCPVTRSAFFGVTSFLVFVIVLLGFVLFFWLNRVARIAKKPSFYTPPPKK